MPSKPKDKDWQASYQAAQAVDAELGHWQEFLQNVLKLRPDIRAKAAEAYAALQPLQAHKDSLEKSNRQAEAESERLQTDLTRVKRQVSQDIQAQHRKAEQTRGALQAELDQAEVAHRRRMEAMAAEYAEAKSRHKDALAELEKDIAAALAKHDKAMDELKGEEREVLKRIEQGQDQLRQLRAIVEKGSRKS